VEVKKNLMANSFTFDKGLAQAYANRKKGLLATYEFPTEIKLLDMSKTETRDALNTAANNLKGLTDAINEYTNRTYRLLQLLVEWN
jgi:hypothetical protein